MRRYWGALVCLALVGCDPELNDPECQSTAECGFRPGTVCSPEGWCVVPEAARIDRGVPLPDMRRPDPVDVGEVDLAVDQAVVDAAGGDVGAVDGGVDFAVDGGAGDGAIGDPDLDLADAAVDLGFADAEAGDFGADDMAASDAVAGDAVVGDAVFIEDAAPAMR